MKKVLFVCVENSCLSQMAEGFAKKLGQGRIEPFGAGSSPSDQVEPLAINVMQERGVDISNQRTKDFGGIEEKDFDYIVTLGCEDVCPFVPARRRIEWDVPDPKGKSIKAFGKTRGIIEEEIREFVDGL